jgi:hypothetical protein
VATYVPISREDFEQWLDSLGHKWRRAPGKEGVYLVELSPDVGVHVSSSVGSQDMAMGRARGAMYMRLVSLKNGRTLNKKDVGQSKFYRTEGWRETLRKAFDRLKQAYMKAKAFYDKLATVDPDSYKADTLALIEEVPGWESDALLRDFHDRVDKGGILSTKQEQLIHDAKAKAKRGEADAGLLDRMRQLWSAAKHRGDQWTMDFVKSLGDQIKARRTLSDRQRTILTEKFTQYRIASALSG